MVVILFVPVSGLRRFLPVAMAMDMLCTKRALSQYVHGCSRVNVRSKSNTGGGVGVGGMVTFVALSESIIYVSSPLPRLTAASNTMLSDAHLWECLILLLALRLTDQFDFDYWLQLLPWLRPIVAWLCVAPRELFESCLRLCPRWEADFRGQRSSFSLLG